MSILLVSTDSTNQAAVSWNTLRARDNNSQQPKTHCTEAACLGGASPRPRKKKRVGLRKPQEAEKTGKGNAKTAAGKQYTEWTEKTSSPSRQSQAVACGPLLQRALRWIRINPIENSRRA